MGRKSGEWKKANGLIKWARLLLLLAATALSGCSLEDAEPAFSSGAGSAVAGTSVAAAEEQDAVEPEAIGTAGCEAYEEEAEPGVCSYIVDCGDADECELWSERMIGEMEEWLGDLTYSEEWDVDELDSQKEADVLASYEVEGNELDLTPSDEEEEYYAWLWDRFAWIIPSDHRQMVKNFELYDHADLLAYVIQDDEDYENWTYAANQIQSTYETERVMTDIHEFGHLLSLNAEQVDPYADESECDTYMLDEGCPYQDSYIYQFYKQFWKKAVSEDEEDYVTGYAMTSVYEDFAESWSYFVMTVRPEGDSLADRKVRFFYNYDELVLLKASILGRAASWIDRNAVWE
ncbi:hypothetical protein DFP98_10163 [Cohnella phaseoli]|uniref:Zinc-binding metallo-peptidase n=2 Tax=Cohnella phaseoli TaxID=456490 RepID=A0A3D9KRP2_9BACL|nr:hypothetical protein DFP98_10163 [Cohnella phaseoli]